MARTYSVRIPGPEYWKEQVKCQYACPVHTDAGGYVRAIADGDIEAAYLIARAANPLASMCGRICGAPCEANCRRADVDQPVAIRALKRFACDSFGPATGMDLVDLFRRAAQGRAPHCHGREDVLALVQALAEGRVPKVAGRVAIIGGGPAGLAAAHDLALMGLSPTVLDMEDRPGGMLYVGVPSFRLPREIIAAEIAIIRAMGVAFRPSTAVGRDVPLRTLIEEFDAVLIAVGAKRSLRAAIPGEEAHGVLGGIDFLRDVALGHPVDVGSRVVVIGGGDVALDSARAALRLGAPGDGPSEGYEEMDSARTALRLGAQRVRVVYRRSRAEMPGHGDQVQQAEGEGVEFQLLAAPLRILADDRGRVRAVECVRMRLGEPDSSGRPRPMPIEGSEFTIEADTVVTAIGQMPDLGFVDAERTGIEVSQTGLLRVDPETLATTCPKVFAAGDVAHGTRLMIDAIASGKRAARSIYRFLTGREITFEQTTLHSPIRQYGVVAGRERSPRAPEPAGRGYDASVAAGEAARCLRCRVNTIFDAARCILCGRCVDACPKRCLRLVSAARLEGGHDLHTLRRRVAPRARSQAASAMIKDETLCIRCGLCAARCPTGAVTMERFSFEERPACRTAQEPCHGH